MSADCRDCAKRRRQERVRASIPRPFGDCTAPGCVNKVEYQALWPLCITHAVPIYEAMLTAERNSLELARSLPSPSRTDRDNAQDANDEKMQAGAEGFIYYLLVADRVKIGFSIDIRQRMRAYPPGSELLAVEPGSMELEKQRHREFAHVRRSGREWFMPCPEIDAHVVALVEQHGNPARFGYRFRERATAGGPTPRGWRGSR